MVKGGNDKDARATESLADIGSSVLNGALSTLLAVAILFLSKSYVFRTLATQFALTVVLGVAHGLILLPVLLSLFGPKPYASAESIAKLTNTTKPKQPTATASASEVTEEIRFRSSSESYALTKKDHVIPPSSIQSRRRLDKVFVEHEL